MGRKVLITFLVLIGLILFAFVALGITSHYITPDVGMVDGKLKVCPGNPNCVCSESYAESDASHHIPPVKLNGTNIEVLWKLLRQAVIDQGGQIVREDDSYLHAEFTSSIFRFVDDLELRMDRQNGLIHLRSASRVGRSDLGANRKRIEAIWHRLGESD
jgi:uncharacterized protein (DUF1499 family)